MGEPFDSRAFGETPNMKLLLTFLAFALPQVIRADLASDLQANGLTTLLSLVVDAGLADTLASVEPATIFAPTNEAFAALPQETLNALTSDPELLKSTLLYHVIPNAAISSNQLKPDQSVETAAGAPLRVNVYPSYGTTVTVNGVPVVTPDVPAGSGSVVHVVEKVIPTIKAGDNVAAVVSSNEKYSTLLAAVKAAGLVDALASTDGITVFAPTNDAFAKIPEDTLASIPADKDLLTSILTRHVVPNVIYSEGLCWKTYPTLNPAEKLSTQLYKLQSYGKTVGMSAKVKTSAGVAKIVQPDIVATNGVIHGIDTVV